MAKSYREEPAQGKQKLLLIIFIVLLVIGLFMGLVWPGFWIN